MKLNATSKNVVENWSNKPCVAEMAVVQKPTKKRNSESAELAALNADMSANADLIIRAAQANTLRLTGKPTL